MFGLSAMIDQSTVKEWFTTRKLWGHNTSGVRGVSWDSSQQKWTVRFKHEGKYKFFGYFENKEEAIMVREQTERRFLQ